MYRSKEERWCTKAELSRRYNKQRLHKARYFRELLATPDIDEGLSSLLRICRERVVRLGKTESALVHSLERDALLVERVERLMSIPSVGPITALTWALEIGEVQRFSPIKKAITALNHKKTPGRPFRPFEGVGRCSSYMSVDPFSSSTVSRWQVVLVY